MITETRKVEGSDSIVHYSTDVASDARAWEREHAGRFTPVLRTDDMVMGTASYMITGRLLTFVHFIGE